MRYVDVKMFMQVSKFSSYQFICTSNAIAYQVYDCQKSNFFKIIFTIPNTTTFDVDLFMLCNACSTRDTKDTKAKDTLHHKLSTNCQCNDKNWQIDLKTNRIQNTTSKIEKKVEQIFQWAWLPNDAYLIKLMKG